MVIYYRNKFLEVFGVSMLLFIFIIGWIIFLLSNVDNLFWVGMGKLMPAIGIIAIIFLQKLKVIPDGLHCWR